MALSRATCQRHGTLEEFYSELAASEDSISAAIGASMIGFLPLLRDACAEHEVWGLTSHSRLWLLAKDDYTSVWLVSIQAWPADGFRIQYRMPRDEAPWSEAIVEGFARDEAEACALVRIAMNRCKGWP
jgi:hypothetical protein